MEEASVAGESPDKSKQRESSAEPTPGSAGPVPEARSEGDAAGKRDPRLAVTRDTSSPSSSTASASTSDASTSSKAAASASDRGGVDTATRVLSERDAQSEGGEAEDSVEAADSDSESADGTPDGRDDSATDGNGQLHAVVAAWVRSAEEVDQDEGGEGAQGAQGAQEAEEAADGDTGTESGPEDGKDGSAGRDEGSGGASEGGAADDAVAAGESGEPGGSGGSGGSEEPDEADAGDEPGSAHDTDADSDAEVKAEVEVGPEADADSAPEDEAAPAAEDDSASSSESADDSAGDDTGAGPEAEGAKAAPGPSADKADDTGSDDGEGTGDAEPPTDQPTAVFKAPRPSAPAVDQPTTMLKLGDAAKDVEKADRTDKAVDKAADKAGSVDRPDSKAKGEDAPESAPDSDPESASESAPGRAGTFVPLKDLDDPETRKPSKRGDSATTSLRLPPSAQARPAAPPAEGTRSVPQVGPELTRQQPLPPKPPLDLLAELTNTPPPPDTPLRTTLRRVKIWTPLVALLVIVFAVVQNMRALPTPTLELTAEDTFTFAGGKVDIPWPADGQAALDVQGIGTFGSSGEQKPVPIASVAKVMTTYLILREHPLKSGAKGPMIEIDGPAEEQSDAGQESTVDVTAGDKISQREALEAVLIASANNVARLVARWDAGSEEAFVEKMNKAAEDLGMTNTTYTDPSGLNNTTVSTAVDQVKLARAAMEQPAFREIAAMMSYDDYKGVNHPNWNQLVGSNGVVGIKTGTTTSALGNLVFAAKKDVDGETRTIVGAVVRQPAGGADNTILAGALSAGDQLIRAAQGALESATVLKEGSVVGYVDDGLGGRTPVALTEDVRAAGWPGLKVKLTFTSGELPHQAKAGTEVGSLTVGDGTNSGAVKVPVALQEDLVEPGFPDKLTRLT
ncbi:D-alanyl-D-alanine carboxypeptidase [Streptomyces sp. NPDC085927]|uniref:D-alanyl-D-alanine carboxypeptidase n=1 Tax=Streptomyces sp. NPDC085927 TaxID=3365738 RepID=UPI0037D125E9